MPTKLEFGVVIAILSLTFIACNPPIQCADTILREAVSPDQSSIVTLFERDCGATTRKSLHLSLRKRSDRFDPEKQHSFFITDENGKLRFEWSNSNKLIVHVDGNARTFRKDQESSGITIEYSSQ